MEHLSPAPLSPHGLTKESFGALESRYCESSDLSRRQAVLAKRIKRMSELDALDDEKLTEFLNSQKELLQKTDPSLTPSKAEELAILAVGRYVREIQLPSSLSDTQQLLENTNHPAIKKLSGRFSDTFQVDLCNFAFEKALEENASSETLEEYLSVCEEKSSRDVRDHIIINTLHNCEGSNKPYRQKLLNIAGKTNIDISYMTSPGSYSGSTNEIISTIRYEEASKQKSTIDFLSYLSNHWHNKNTSEHESAILDFSEFSSLENPSNILEFLQWREYLDEKFNNNFHLHFNNPLTTATKEDGEFKIPKVLEEMPDKITQRLLISCLRDDPIELAEQLVGRDDINGAQKQKIMHLWISFRRLNPNRDVNDRLQELPALMMVNSKEFSLAIEDIIDVLASKTAKQTIYKTQSILDRVFDKNKENSQADFLFMASKESEKILEYMTLAALETLISKEESKDLTKLLYFSAPIRISSFKKVEEYDIKSTWEEAVKKLLQKDNLLEDEDNLKALIALGLMSDNIEVNLQMPSKKQLIF